MPTNWLEAQTQLTDRRDMLAALLVLDTLRDELMVAPDGDEDDAVTLVDGATVDVEPFLSSDALELRAVERALERIQDGTFGTCEQCAGEIEPARMARIPWSRCCAQCVAFTERELRAVAADPAECADCAAEREARAHEAEAA